MMSQDFLWIIWDIVSHQAKNMMKYKIELLKLGKLVREVIIGGRRVSVFRLTKPLKYKDYSISALELVEPKSGEKPLSGFEHAEFTISGPFEDIVKKYPNLPWDTTNIERPDFPRLKLVFDNRAELKFNFHLIRPWSSKSFTRGSKSLNSFIS